MLLEYSVEEPLNREPPAPQLIEEFITPVKVAYDRNHGPLPHLDIEKHLVRVDGAVTEILELSAKVLREEFEQHEVVAALQCAGNRRHTMRTELKEVNGIDWFEGAVMNGRWKGPLLKDVLERAGIEIEGKANVAFSCYQTDVQDDRYYGGSIPLERALDGSKKAMLALELNGKPLDINHGFPVRLVIPGIAGARWVKWIDRITVQRPESNNFYQQRDYKILPPEVTTKEMAVAHWHLVPSIEGMPVNSVICYPATGQVIERQEDETVLVGGYALPANDDGPVTRVEVSTDMGKTWDDAEITCEPTLWSWAIWRYKMPKEQVDKLEKGSRIWCRATDKGGNVQPEKCEWNWRGVAYNAYGEIKNFVIVPHGGVAKELSNLNLDAARDPIPLEDESSNVASA